MDTQVHTASFRTVMSCKTKDEFELEIYACWEKLPANVIINSKHIFGRNENWQKRFLEVLVFLYRCNTIMDIVFSKDGNSFQKVEVPWS